MNEHDAKAVKAFFAQIDENGVSNAEKARTLHRTIRRIDTTSKDKSYEEVAEPAKQTKADSRDDAGADAGMGANPHGGFEASEGPHGNAGGNNLPIGVVEVDGKFVGLGIHILNEDVYPLQSFEIYLRGCDLVGHLDLSGCTDVVFVDLYRNRLSSVDVANMPALRILGLQDNQIEALDPTELPACQGIDAGLNRLTAIDVSRNPELVELYVNDNRIESLDTSANPKLKYLRCQNNLLHELDTTANPLLRHLYATGNPLKSIRALAPGQANANPSMSEQEPEQPKALAHQQKSEEASESNPQTEDTQPAQGQEPEKKPGAQTAPLLPLELFASEGGYVGLSFNPIYNAQWKETGEWEQSYHAYPDEGFAFAGWYDISGACLSHEQDWSDEYGASRQISARFLKTAPQIEHAALAR